MENLFASFKHFSGVMTRFDKLKRSYYEISSYPEKIVEFVNESCSIISDPKSVKSCIVESRCALL